MGPSGEEIYGNGVSRSTNNDSSLTFDLFIARSNVVPIQSGENVETSFSQNDLKTYT